ncbi:hypothetical protein D3C84_729610 [compost metagenome]
MYSIPVGASLLAIATCQPTEILQKYSVPVGASLLAMAACQPTEILQKYSVPVGASLLAIAACQPTRYPTDERIQQTGRPVGRLGRCCGVRPLVRPSGGSAQWATRHGCRVSRPRPWMADGGGLCRSELAREKPESTAGCQASRIIVDLHREQARSHSDLQWPQVSSKTGSSMWVCSRRRPASQHITF